MPIFSRPMTIQRRFWLYTVMMLLLSFGVFSFAVFQLPNQVLNNVDNRLLILAQSMVEEAAREDDVEWSQQFDWPTTLLGYQTASSFFVVINTKDNGKVIKHSANISDGVAPLDLSMARSDKPQFTTRQLANGDSIRVFSYPIVLVYGTEQAQKEQVGVLQVGQLISDYTFFNRLIFPTITLGFSGLLGCFGFFSLLAPTILQPLEKITLVAQHITKADDLSHRIPDPTNDELGDLVKVLNQLMERMETLFQTQQRLLADVSHELRTPLTAIRGNVDLMRMMNKVDEDSLKAIEMESKRMSRLVDDLLTLARAEAGGLPIRRELLSLDRLVLEVYEQILYLKYPVRVILKNVTSAYIVGDSDRLKQLLINLMTNAVKYTDPGGTVQISMTTDGNQQAIFSVSDTGIGISKEDLPHIFDRFYRVNRARTRERGGSGLGLSIVKSIVDAHKGTIKVESEAGVGSTFTVFFPLAKEHVQLVAEEGEFDSEFEE